MEFEGDVTAAEREAFYARAPGLADFINLLAEERIRAGKRQQPNRKSKSANIAAKTKKKSVEVESTEDESEEESRDDVSEADDDSLAGSNSEEETEVAKQLQSPMDVLSL